MIKIKVYKDNKYITTAKSKREAALITKQSETCVQKAILNQKPTRKGYMFEVVNDGDKT